jgi:carbonyl reductase 1
LEIVRKLCKQSNLHVILGCRNEQLGNEAVSSLHQQGFKNCEFRQLDISNGESINIFALGIERDFSSSLDILVNNAGTAFKSSDPTPFPQQARPTVNTNYFGTLHLTERLLPFLRKAKHFGRLVNVASESGHLRIIKDKTLKKRFSDIENLSIPQLSDLMNKFMDDVEAGRHTEEGWPSTCYGMSKLAVIAMTKRFAYEEQQRKSGEAATKPVLITCCCPGYCDTDMTSHQGTKSAAEGASTPAFLALQSEYDENKNGKFFSSEKEIEW